MSRRLILPFAFTVAIFASAEPTVSTAGKSSGAFYVSGDKSGAKSSPASDGDYELRGFFGAGDDIEVSVRRAGTGNSHWLRVGRKFADLLIEKADPRAGTATLVVNGRRRKLRLAGETTPSAPLMPISVETVQTSAPDYKSREYRRKRIEAAQEKMTDAQQEAAGRVMEEHYQKMNRENPDFDFRDPKNADAAFKMHLAATREASEAAHKLPDKDGNITPVPADFELLVRGEFDDRMERRKAHQAEIEKSGQKTGSGTITLSGAGTYSGATTVNSGTLSISNGETPSTPGR